MSLPEKLRPPFYKGRGEHSVVALESMINQYQRFCEQEELRINALEEKAAKWDALMSCQRIRNLGHAQLGLPHQHIGFELWESYPEKTEGHDYSRETLDTFVTAIAKRRGNL